MIYFKNKIDIKRYEWTDVDVLDYNVAEGKFLVLIHATKSTKLVVRLSLMFNSEDPDAFKERVELSKHRQTNAEDELRF